MQILNEKIFQIEQTIDKIDSVIEKKDNLSKKSSKKSSNKGNKTIETIYINSSPMNSKLSTNITPQ